MIITKSKKISISIALCLCCTCALIILFTSPLKSFEPEAISTYELFVEMLSHDPIVRDQYIETKEGKTLYGKAIYKSASAYLRYDRQFRIIASPIEENVNFIYYLYTNNKNFFRRLKSGNIFDFKGKLILATSINLSKDAYILDIALEE